MTSEGIFVNDFSITDRIPVSDFSSRAKSSASRSLIIFFPIAPKCSGCSSFVQERERVRKSPPAAYAWHQFDGVGVATILLNGRCGSDIFFLEYNKGE